MSRVSLVATLCVVALPACGTNAFVDTNAGATALRDGASLATMGALCSTSAACESNLCLRLTENAQDASGLCSAACRQSSECGDQALCIAQTTADGGSGDLDAGAACYRSCGAPTDCLGGIPCVWQASLDAGLCAPLRSTFCNDLGDAGACDSCLGSHCCAEVTACAEDVGCSKGETISAWDSGNLASAAVASCAAANCAMACP